jgi:hypothetical protein
MEVDDEAHASTQIHEMNQRKTPQNSRSNQPKNTQNHENEKHCSTT